MLNATSTDLSLPTLHRHEPSVARPCQEPGSQVARHQRSLLQAVMASLSGTIGSVLLPTMTPHLLSGIGRELGRRAFKPLDHVQIPKTDSLHEQLLDCFQQLETQWGCHYQIVDRSMGRLEFILLDCPLESQQDAPPHLCWLYAGMLGEVAGSLFGYAKASVTPCAGTPALTRTSCACRIILYLQKTAESVAAEGTTYPHGHQTADHLPSRAQTGLPLDRLSDREWQVLRLIGEGFSDKEIADALKMSVRTAENHAAKVYSKLGVRGRARLIRYALRHRVVNL